MRPLTILRGAEGQAWTHVDQVLATAHVLAEDLRCTGCGQVKHEAYNPDSEGWYATKTVTCQGCAEVERSTSGEHEHGQKTFVVDERPRDVPLKPWKLRISADGVNARR